MYNVGDIIGNKYRVTGLCSNDGGMGTVLFVEEKIKTLNFKIVLKFCKEKDLASLTRFTREVTYMTNFKGNGKVIQVIDSNLVEIPPYFVMKYYDKGDLSKISKHIQTDMQFQETAFNKAIDAIKELHSHGYQHRDIKPQNFLIDEDDTIVVSDLGLAKNIGAGTTFTQSSEAWGTASYLPPEYRDHGFKESVAASDIFMIGKTFYNLLTDRDPLYLRSGLVNPAIYQIILRCCETEINNRYQTLDDLKQDLKLAYDVILSRASGVGVAIQALSGVINLLNSANQYDPQKISELLSIALKLESNEFDALARDIERPLFQVFAQPEFTTYLTPFLDKYEDFATSAVSLWSYAETVAKNMEVIFKNSRDSKIKLKSLDIAINCAILANRFAAMHTCENVIKSITDETVGLSIAMILSKYSDSFIKDIEPSECQCNAIRQRILQIRTT